MRRATVALLLVLAGCGAKYTIHRQSPDGTVLDATAWTAEKTDSVEFRFSGDPDGKVQSLVLRKVGAVPVNLTAETLQAIMGLSGFAAKKAAVP